MGVTEIEARAGCVIVDGGLATQLEGQGVDLDDPLWSAKVLLDEPERLRAVHRSYLEAGADIIVTATYQATFEGLMARGLDRQEAGAVLRSGTRVAAEARDSFWGDGSGRDGRVRPLVAASVGSYGAFLADGSEYRGDYGLDQGELAHFHRARLAVLAEGADLLAFETIPSIVEARAIATLLDEGAGPPAWVAFCCGDASRLCDGTPIAEIVSVLHACERVWAVGINCTPPRLITPLLRCLEEWPRARIVYPNSGERYQSRAGGWAGNSTSPARLVEYAREWHAAGAGLIGGCCRTTPAHTLALARWREAS